jgi:hypothetical protein
MFAADVGDGLHFRRSRAWSEAPWAPISSILEVVGPLMFREGRSIQNKNLENCFKCDVTIIISPNIYLV